MMLVRFIFCPVFLLLPLLAPAQSGTLRVVLSNIEFSAEKTSLNVAGRQELDEVARLLKISPAATAEIGAHTDAGGSASYNLKLSRNRATAVRTYLVGKGIAARRLTARGYGESKPLNRCGRGVRCSDAEKRKNRRVELNLRGLPVDSAARAPWLMLGGLAPKKPVAQPEVPTVKPTMASSARQQLEINTSASTSKPVQGDFFPELNEGKGKEYVPQPLPRTFVGYTIEISCLEKPLAAGAELLRVHEPVYMRQDAEMQYCYFVGAFFTLPEAQQFFQKKLASRLPGARIVTFSNNIKKYLAD